MPDIGQLQSRTAILEVPFAGDIITVRYNPVKVTGKTAVAIQKVQDTNSLEPMFAEVDYILHSWDITLDGLKVPADREGIEMVGVAITVTIFNAILADVRNPTWETPLSQGSPILSSNGSSQTANSPERASQPTQISSYQHNGLASHPGISQDSQNLDAVSAGTPG